MEKTYQIGQDRYRINGYFVYKIENALANKAKNFSYQLPVSGSVILFCSRVGGSELAKFISYDKNLEQATLQFLNDKTSFKFNVSGNEVFIQWDEVTGNDQIVIDYYSEKQRSFISSTLDSTKERLNQLKVINEGYLKNIKDPNTLLDLVNSVKSIQLITNDLIAMIESSQEKLSIEEENNQS